MSYQYIYFDLDDTLLNHKAAEQAGLQDVHSNFALFEEVTPSELIDEYHEVNSEQWGLYSRGEVNRSELQRNRFEKTLQNLQLDVARYEEVGNYYMQCYRNHWQWVDGAKEVYLKIAEHYPVGILTNGFAETQRLKFEEFGLYESANHTVISEDVGVLKPDPKVFDHATQEAGVAKDDILYVGDSFSSDIEGGSQYGWNTAWFTTNGEPEKHAKADFAFKEFEQLEQLLELSNTQS
ncbi:HAD family hydrolase [Fodinibius halophilus]|uniref:HAD-IA family hydrolase n=1 Tax=Fodinibius halophilus TaxID=1736908 RepID=A0A6M1TCA3_9BACT|nr:HAD-IA family hydrolase [Fodinibius halophilus]NGP89993.1 HAD-IA family hydrolase [Fodinibius halophilus]